jgi:hypothetical protein
VTGEDSATACFICLDDTPFGYVQFYCWDNEQDACVDMGWISEPGWWGIDIYIGEADLISHGLGSEAVTAIFDYLACDRAATGVWP